VNLALFFTINISNLKATKIENGMGVKE